MDDTTASNLKAQNGVIEVRRSQIIPPIKTIDKPIKASPLAHLVQTNVTYNLDMMDGRVDGRYEYTGTGEGVDVYIVDSGIKDDHPDFEGRVKWGYTAGNKTDDVGHGTHVAGIVGSKTFGVAKKVNLIAVRIARQHTEEAFVVLGLNYVLEQHKSSGRPSVVNVSWGKQSDEFKYLKDIFKAMIDAGIAIVSAAGNDGQDACHHTPGIWGTFNVAASDDRYKMTTFSNWGECVGIFAPGDEIMSTCSEGPKFCQKSGTSMAAPHVAGVLAQAYSINKFTRVSEAHYYVIRKAQRQKLYGDLKDSPNIFVNTPNGP